MIALDMEGFLFVIYYLLEVAQKDEDNKLLVPDGNYTILDFKRIIYN